MPHKKKSNTRSPKQTNERTNARVQLRVKDNKKPYECNGKHERERETERKERREKNQQNKALNKQQVDTWCVSLQQQPQQQFSEQTQLKRTRRAYCDTLWFDVSANEYGTSPIVSSNLNTFCLT